MIGFLRIAAVLNASIWLGATVFFTFFAGPAFFSEPMLALLGRPHAGAAAQLVLERYFLLHLLCGGLALGLGVGESLYLGRPVLRWSLSLLGALFVLGLVGGQGIQPRLKSLHRAMYQPGNSLEVRDAAAGSFRLWHGISQGLNLLVLAGVTTYVWRVTRPMDASRYRP